MLARRDRPRRVARAHQRFAAHTEGFDRPDFVARGDRGTRADADDAGRHERGLRKLFHWVPFPWRPALEFVLRTDSPRAYCCGADGHLSIFTWLAASGWQHQMPLQAIHCAALR
jgi:hypothetical protein